MVRGSRLVPGPLGRKYLCAAAAYRGNLELLKRLRDIGSFWDKSTCLAAASKKHAHIIEYCTENKCPGYEILL
jgi:hypothetical protein